MKYYAVIARPKLGLPEGLAAAVLDAINDAGLSLGRTISAETFPDPKDVVFYGHREHQALPQEAVRRDSGGNACHP